MQHEYFQDKDHDDLKESTEANQRLLLQLETAHAEIERLQKQSKYFQDLAQEEHESQRAEIERLRELDNQNILASIVRRQTIDAQVVAIAKQATEIERLREENKMLRENYDKWAASMPALKGETDDSLQAVDSA